MRRLLRIIAKSVLVLFAIAILTLLAAAGLLIWRFERALPDVGQLAANSSTGPICSGGNHGAYVPLAEIPPLLLQAAIASGEPSFYERWSLNPFVERVHSIFDTKIRPSNITLKSRDAWSR